MFAKLRLNRGMSAAVLCAGLTLAALPWFMRSGDAQPPSQPEPLQPSSTAAVIEQPSAPAQEEVKEEKMPSAAAGALLEKHLKQYLDDTEKMLDGRINGLKGFFEECKRGAPLYASQTLDLNAKVRAAGGMLETFLYQVGKEMGGAGRPAGPDSFTVYARRCFQQNVLDPLKARQAMDAVIAGFRGDIAEADGRLLVALKADIGDDAIDPGQALPQLNAEGRVFDLSNALVAQTVDEAVNDLNASLAMFLASNELGNMVADQLTPEDASATSRFLTSLITGIAVDAALEQGVRSMGYNPEGNVVAKVNSGIDRIRAAIIDGDPAMTKIYPTLTLARRTHPDPAVRSACQRADEAVVAAANIGLRSRLQRVRNDRYRGLWKALMTQLAGPEAAASPFLMYQPLDAATCSPPAEFIEWADSLTRTYGGK